MNNSRYHRQQQVPQMGLESTQRLADAHVLIIGAGGLGSPVSLFLTGAGVGEITLVDHDEVSLSNLHRQILFNEADIGTPKATSAQKHLHARNREITINAIPERLSIRNAAQLVTQATVVVDAADNFLVSYLLSDLCLEKRIPLVSASVLTTHGYLGVFCGTKDKPAPSLRAVFPSPSSEVNNCNTAGVTGPSVGIIASYQAQEVLKVIMGSDSQLLGKLMNLDLWDYRQYIIDFSKSSEPDIKASIIAIEQLTNKTVLLDVRSSQECQDDPVSANNAHVFIRNIPLHELQERIDELDSQQPIACICKSGQRALNAAQQLIDAGFSNVSVTQR